MNAQLCLEVLIFLLVAQQVCATICYREERFTGKSTEIVCGPGSGLCAKYEYGDGSRQRDCDLGDCRSTGVYSMPAYNVYCCARNLCNNSTRNTHSFILTSLAIILLCPKINR